MNFFVIEDHSLTNRGIRQFLSEYGDFCCAGFAFTAEETLRKLGELAEASSLPEILILDLNLNGESGIPLIKEAKRLYPSLKIVVYSMYTNPGIVSLALESGIQGFVAKSEPEETLAQALIQVAGGGSFIQPDLIPPLFIYRNILDSLTRQEQNTLRKVIERKTNEQIASELNLSVRSVENYLSRIYSKTGCRNHEELIVQFG